MSRTDEVVDFVAVNEDRAGERRELRPWQATDEDLDEVLERTAARLGEDDHRRAARLLAEATLEFIADGGIYYPMPGNTYDANTFEAVLTVPHASVGFEPGVQTTIWAAMQPVLERLGVHPDEVSGLRLHEEPEPLPDRDPEWRAKVPAELPTNQARRERPQPAQPSADVPTLDGLFFGSEAEVTVYRMLRRLQRALPQTATIAIAALPGVAMRDTNGPTLTPDLLVVGNGRAVVVETDGSQHRGRGVAVDDQNRNRHWQRCGLPPAIRVSTEDLSRRTEEVERVLREDLARHLDIPDLSADVGTERSHR